MRIKRRNVSRRRLLAGLLAAGLGAVPTLAQGEAPRPPSNVAAVDAPWDNGTKINLTWSASPDEAGVRHYEVRRAIASIGGNRVATPVFDVVAKVPVNNGNGGTYAFTVTDLPYEIRKRDFKNFPSLEGAQALLDTGRPTFRPTFLFEVAAVGKDGAASAAARLSEPIQPIMQWFDGGRFYFLLTLIVFCGAVLVFIVLARGGKPLKVRKIAGLEAVDEAVGRATEMGRSILFIPGINVLSHVARTSAEYDAKVEVPTSRSLVMTTARETVQNAFLAAGRPDAYNEDLIYYVTDEQFGYVAYLQGMMVRQKPAACFYMGSFFAESLILAETGNSIGAIQVAGTAQPAQLPFFVAACDYTLIGEEFFAASAYLSGSPEELGSLKGQDVGKVIVGVGMLLGVVAWTLAAMTESEFLQGIVDFMRGTLLV
ncbi:MAG: fibronectin type III domain-containing protein [Phycisphaerales bacterium]|nr:fibronectin type III domain-containing protein [Phycisphaerales bacterium]